MTGTARAVLRESNDIFRTTIGPTTGDRLNARPDLIVARPEGLYCPPGDFYIDPWRPVERAVITHAHADHARSGHRPLPRGRAPARACCARGWASIDLQGAGLRRAHRHQRRRRCRCIRPAMCSARRRCGSNTAGASGSHPATTRSSRTRPARRSSRCAATPSSPNRPSACRSTAGSRRRRCSPTSIAGGGTTRRKGAPACCSATASARRSASCAGVDPAIGPIFCTARSSRSTAPTAQAGVALPPTRAGHPRSQATRRRSAARWSSRRRRRRAARGCAASATTATPSPAAGCSCAARAGAAGSTAASCCPTTPTGPACMSAIGATGAQRVIVTHG